jgi:NADH-ubiquinone oxidoreductase chain 6
MLIDIRTSELQSYNWNIIPLGIFISIILHYSLSLLLPYYITILPNNDYIYNYILNNKFLLPENIILEDLGKIMNNLSVMYTTSSNWDGNLIEISHAATIGNIIYTTHNLWLFLASFILLLVMIGAIIITITQNSKNRKGN